MSIRTRGRHYRCRWLPWAIAVFWVVHSVTKALGTVMQRYLRLGEGVRVWRGDVKYLELAWIDLSKGCYIIAMTTTTIESTGVWSRQPWD